MFPALPAWASWLGIAAVVPQIITVISEAVKDGSPHVMALLAIGGTAVIAISDSISGKKKEETTTIRTVSQSDSGDKVETIKVTKENKPSDSK